MKHRPKRAKSPTPEERLGALYREAVDVARLTGSRVLDRLTSGSRRDDVFFGAWLARNAQSFKELEKK